jgi:hypothetical protein
MNRGAVLSARLFACLNLRTVGSVFMQFHIVERVIPLEFALNSCFLISYNRNYRHERSVNMQDGNGISENIYA